MRIIVLLMVTSLIAFIVGVAAGGGGVLYLQHLLASNVTARGILIYESENDSSITGQFPQGYYIESTGVGRVYVETSVAVGYLNQQIEVSGKLDTLCGPDGLRCYPVVQQASIVQLR